MKRILLGIFLCAAMALTACGSKNGSSAYTDTSSNTGGNTATPAKQNGDSTLDSAHTKAHVPAGTSGKMKETNPDTTNASSH